MLFLHEFPFCLNEFWWNAGCFNNFYGIGRLSKFLLIHVIVQIAQVNMWLYFQRLFHTIYVI